MAPTRHPMTRADSMQRLQLLTSQQEVLRRRLSLRVPSPTPLTSEEYASLSSSPTQSRASSGQWSPAGLDHSSTHPIPTVPGTAHIPLLDASQHIEDTHKLCEINQQIKATLTELLNTDSVRSDERFRAWVQDRLMDVEQQIRKQRRSHSSVVDREFAASIAMHISPPERGSQRMSWHC